MNTLSIDYPESLPAVLNVSPREFEREARMALAVKLNALERAGLLHLLGPQFGHVLIPSAVEREFLAGHPTGTSFFEATASGLIQVSASTMPLDPLLRSSLDEGEAAVIELAQALSIDQVLIDERKGRKVARETYGLRTLGTARVLLEAKQSGLIDSILQRLESMRDHGYRIHEDIVQAALRQAGEASSIGSG